METFKALISGLVQALSRSLPWLQLSSSLRIARVDLLEVSSNASGFGVYLETREDM